MRKVYHRVAAEGDVAPGTAQAIDVGGEAGYLLVRTADGAFQVVGALCPHQNEPLDKGRIEGCEVVCRRHHLRFDVRTGICTNASGYSLCTLDVRTEAGQVIVGRWEDDP